MIRGAEFHWWGVERVTTEDTFPGSSQPDDASTVAQPTAPAAGNGSEGPARKGRARWPDDLHAGALILGGVTTTLVALRLLSVAKANPETAYGILQAGGTTNVIIGTVLSLIPSIALIVASCLTLSRIWAKVSSSRVLTQLEELGVWGSICTLFLIAALTIPFRYWPAPAAVVIALAVAGISRNRIEKRRQEARGRVAVKVAAVVIAGAFLLGVIASPPWMPAARLTFSKASGQGPIAGYVLSQSDTGLTVLELDPRTILYFGPGELASQTACSAFPPDDLPIVYKTWLKGILDLYAYPHC